jgi:hypothetical protein
MLLGPLHRVRQQFGHAVVQLGRIAADVEHVGTGQAQLVAQPVEYALASVFDVLVERLVHVNEIQEEKGAIHQGLRSTDAALQGWTAICSEKTFDLIIYLSISTQNLDNWFRT